MGFGGVLLGLEDFYVSLEKLELLVVELGGQMWKIGRLDRFGQTWIER